MHYLILLKAISTSELIVKLLTPILPILMLLIGGQKLLNLYLIRQKKRESEIELVKSIKNQQYNSIKKLYNLFAKFMELYRIINSPMMDFKNEEQKYKIFREIVESEASIDSLILEVGSEFITKSDNQEELENLLGNLRQSVQIWRESLTQNKTLPFYYSEEPNYLKFKKAFAELSAFMINRIQRNMEPHEAEMQKVRGILIGVFDNKFEDL